MITHEVIGKPRMQGRSALVVVLLMSALVVVPATQAQAQAEEVEGTQVLRDKGFAGPESMLHDEERDVYLVSNINGAPLEADDNGFISRVSPEGEVLELRWIDGESEEVELHAPKGMAISGNTLFVADIDKIRMFDLKTGETAGSIEVTGATFLNDVAAAHDAGVLVTDTGVGPDFQPNGTAALYYVLPDGTVERVLGSPEIEGPNGVTTADDDSVVVVTFLTPGRILHLTEGQVANTMEMTFGGLDGVVSLSGGTLLVSSWSDSAVFSIGPDGSVNAVVEGVESPADIGFDAGRQRILLPLLELDEVRFVELPEAAER